MGVNTLAPFGLVRATNLLGAAPTQQANTTYKIKAGYGTKIGFGDLVNTGTAGSQGYLVLGATANQHLGVFAGCLPYFDSNLQQTVFTQWWTGTANATADVQCYVIDDPFAVFKVQMSGGPWTASMRGQNVVVVSDQIERIGPDVASTR